MPVPPKAKQGEWEQGHKAENDGEKPLGYRSTWGEVLHLGFFSSVWWTKCTSAIGTVFVEGSLNCGAVF